MIFYLTSALFAAIATCVHTNELQNVALAGTANQSSTLNTQAAASFAIDGDNDTWSETEYSQNEYWEVDLGDWYFIESINLITFQAYMGIEIYITLDGYTYEMVCTNEGVEFPAYYTCNRSVRTICSRVKIAIVRPDPGVTLKLKEVEILSPGKFKKGVLSSGKPAIFPKISGVFMNYLRGISTDLCRDCRVDTTGLSMSMSIPLVKAQWAEHFEFVASVQGYQYIVKTRSVRSDIECALLCTRTVDCMSVNVLTNDLGKTCQLLSSDRTTAPTGPQVKFWRAG